MKFMQKKSLSNNIKGCALSIPNGEFAWNYDNIFMAIDEIIDNGYGILGGEIWAIEKSFSQSSISAFSNGEYNGQKVLITSFLPIKGKKLTAVASWNVDKKTDENWKDFVSRSREQNITELKKLHDRLSNELDQAKIPLQNLFFNLIFISELKLV